jgi:magnesium dechelatase
VNRLKPTKLHVRLADDIDPAGPVVPRFYTLTHSDRTGELYLTIGSAHDLKQISGWYTRLMRDEVLAAWSDQGDGPALHVHCHVSGGLILGSPRWRDAILRHEMPLVLEALRYGDRFLYQACPELEGAPIRVHFHARRARYDRVESGGIPADYR